MALLLGQGSFEGSAQVLSLPLLQRRIIVLNLRHVLIQWSLLFFRLHYLAFDTLFLVPLSIGKVCLKKNFYCFAFFESRTLLLQ
jgi:hypothetical protein